MLLGSWRGECPPAEAGSGFYFQCTQDSEPALSESKGPGLILFRPDGLAPSLMGPRCSPKGRHKRSPARKRWEIVIN